MLLLGVQRVARRSGVLAGVRRGTRHLSVNELAPCRTHVRCRAFPLDASAYDEWRSTNARQWLVTSLTRHFVRWGLVRP